MHPTILAAFFEFSRTAFSMSAAGLALLVIGLLAAKSDVAQARGLGKIVAMANLCFAIPLAAGVLAPLGLTLSPEVGAILMSASTMVVALNAQLLRRLDLRRPAPPSGLPASTEPETATAVAEKRSPGGRA